MPLVEVTPRKTTATARCILAVPEYNDYFIFCQRPHKDRALLFSKQDLAPFGYQPRIGDRVQFVLRETHRVHPAEKETLIIELLDVRLKERNGLKVVK